jgi:hypothetical protein
MNGEINLKIDLSRLSKEERDVFARLTEKASRENCESRIWKPECGEWYWYIGSDGRINNCEWENDRIDRGRYSMGNCFRTKEEAEFAGEKQKIKIELQRFADKYNDPDQEEWDGENYHYKIGYDIDDNDLVTTRSLKVRQDDIHFSSKEIAEDAANKIGVKHIMKYLFNIESEEE